MSLTVSLLYLVRFFLKMFAGIGRLASGRFAEQVVLRLSERGVLSQT